MHIQYIHVQYTYMHFPDHVTYPATLWGSFRMWRPVNQLQSARVAGGVAIGMSSIKARGGSVQVCAVFFSPRPPHRMTFTLPLPPSLSSHKGEVIVSGPGSLHWRPCWHRLTYRGSLFSGVFSGNWQDPGLWTSSFPALPLWRAIVSAAALLFRKKKPSRQVAEPSLVGLSPLEKTMPENVCVAGSCFPVKGDAYEGSRERIVDIYVSAESLKVYDNPWVEASPATTPAPLEPGRRPRHSAQGLDCCIVSPLCLPVKCLWAADVGGGAVPAPLRCWRLQSLSCCWLASWPSFALELKVSFLHFLGKCHVDWRRFRGNTL